MCVFPNHHTRYPSAGRFFGCWGKSKDSARATYFIRFETLYTRREGQYPSYVAPLIMLFVMIGYPFSIFWLSNHYRKALYVPHIYNTQPFVEPVKPPMLQSTAEFPSLGSVVPMVPVTAPPRLVKGWYGCWGFGFGFKIKPSPFPTWITPVSYTRIDPSSLKSVLLFYTLFSVVSLCLFGSLQFCVLDDKYVILFYPIIFTQKQYFYNA